MVKSNLLGKVFGDLTIIKEVKKPKNLNRKGFYWLAKCKCGGEVVGITQSFVSEGRRHCGCRLRMNLSNSHKGKRIINIIGERIGKLVVLKQEGVGTNNKIKYRCKCDCGNEMVTLGSALRRKDRPTHQCFRCGRIEAKEKISGSNHYLWNPKLSNEERINGRRHSILYPQELEWRIKVFKRDNYICGVCHKKEKKINAHHLNNYKQFDNLRFDVNNGITLCEKHHHEFHQMYGLRGSTKKQFDSYLDYKGISKCQ